jgi:hypothetical protein
MRFNIIKMQEQYRNGESFISQKIRKADGEICDGGISAIPPGKNCVSFFLACIDDSMKVPFDETMSTIELGPYLLHEEPELRSQSGFTPVGLKNIYHFAVEMDRLFTAGSRIAICAGKEKQAMTNAALLVGSFLIMRLELQVSDVVDAFLPISPQFEAHDDFSLEDCWRSIHHTKSLGWLDFELPSSQPASPTGGNPAPHAPAIDMREYLHYDDPANGGFHPIVPDRLLLFPEPHPTPDGRTWHDAGGARRFSPAFYADLFPDFGVALVLRVTPRPPPPPAPFAAPFAARGIAAEDLPLDAAGADLLRVIDRFLALARRAPGAVAVHGGRAGLGAAEPLVAACLITQHGFRAAAAVAWLHIAHPPAGLRRRSAAPAPPAGPA